MLGLVGGAVLDIYSSGLAMLAMGVRVPRYVAALIDGAIMVIGTVYVVFFGDGFLGQFQGFLITLGVPVAAWCGVLLAGLGGREGDWAFANLGVLLALALAFLATLVGTGAAVRAQETTA